MLTDYKHYTDLPTLLQAISQEVADALEVEHALMIDPAQLRARKRQTYQAGKSQQDSGWRHLYLARRICVWIMRLNKVPIRQVAIHMGITQTGVGTLCQRASQGQAWENLTGKQRQALETLVLGAPLEALVKKLYTKPRRLLGPVDSCHVDNRLTTMEQNFRRLAQWAKRQIEEQRATIQTMAEKYTKLERDLNFLKLTN